MSKTTKERSKNNQKGYFSARIKKEFERINIAQGEVIQAIGKTQSYVSVLMNGKKQIGKDIAKLLFEKFNMDVLVLLYGDDPIVDDLILFYKNNNLPKNSNLEPKLIEVMKDKDLQQQLIDSLRDQIEMKNEKIKMLERELDKSPKENQNFIND